MIKTLEQLQSSLTIFYTNVKNFHWNLQDKDFLVLHKFSDKLAQKPIILLMILQKSSDHLEKLRLLILKKLSRILILNYLNPKFDVLMKY
ncbi:hypothetical protein [Mesomycoplasma hyopneumoniae]|uniref:hypothetical protein n=1 Tax=Mesomycoplasma hyopneumoniae TaxID=2099 RepID=UPI001E50E861|nr:hypothetical protein [Mesomycoplasma hyopneumoniae]